MQRTDRAARAIERLEVLARIGHELGKGGTTRPGLSRAEQQAHDLVATWLVEAGLTVSVDAVGNLYGRLAGTDPDAPEIWVGSHLDSVPDGGRFDGALGVVAAIEAIEARASASRRATLCVVAFRDEEGWRFGVGCSGSLAVCGRISADDLARTDEDDVSVAEALAALGLAGPPVGVRLPGTFIELHIEQGPVLALEGSALGLVTAIAGQGGFTVEFHGHAGHAGTVPMAGRRDAFAAAAAFALALYEAARALPGAVATIGDLRIANPAANVVPGQVWLSVDVRAQDPVVLESLSRAVEQLAVREAERAGCTADIVQTWSSAPIPLSQRIGAAIRSTASAPLIALPSGAGHDAGVLAHAGVESAMIFVRSLNGGVSHRPDELSSQADIQDAIDLLAGTLAALEGDGE